MSKFSFTMLYVGVFCMTSLMWTFSIMFSTISSVVSGTSSLVFGRKDFCEARPKMQSVFRFSYNLSTLSQMDLL